MPQRLTAINNETGQKVTFEWNAPTPPTDADMEEIFAEAGRSVAAKAVAAPEADGGSGNEWVVPALGVAGAIGAGLLVKNPALIKSGLNQVNNVRIAAMLAGWAPVKSTLGNAGAIVNAAAERGTMAPIKEALRLPTNIGNLAKNFYQGSQGAYGTHPISPGLERFYNIPGRFMGAMDETTGAILQRAGLNQDEAARELLQGPMSPNMVAALEKNPIGNYMVPFPKIPFNFFTEGVNSFKALGNVPQTAEDVRKLILLGGQMGAGAAVGANTEGYLPPALMGAAAGRYGLPSLAGGVMARFMQGRPPNAVEQIGGQAAPYSDYGFIKGFTQPLEPIQRFLRRIGAV